ncbi:hypothetical protein [Microterricola pindariensis]|uniref:DUF3618 domain-containing protein n=1 Tax=Microterricola pindariensis TaxID=478010 RepID=A0ABX5B0H6_9MICO|nr:hypothetical protein [Microterricola pindariensis]PPL20294.1 hypothetical protein GY24_01755 [Microterricola pindariensis]
MSNTEANFGTNNPGFGTDVSTDDTRSTTERAADVKDASLAAGQHVAEVAQDEIHRVGTETKKQARELYRETQAELADQAAAQQKRVATGLRSFGDELASMAASSESPGVASDLAQQAATRASSIADWLDRRDPGSLLNEVKSYARRQPGTFIAIAAAAGVVAGRLTRSMIADNADQQPTGSAAPPHSATSTAPRSTAAPTPATPPSPSDPLAPPAWPSTSVGGS